MFDNFFLCCILFDCAFLFHNCFHQNNAHLLLLSCTILSNEGKINQINWTCERNIFAIISLVCDLLQSLVLVELVDN